MLIKRHILPTTGKTFDDITGKLKAIKGCILTLKSETFTATDIANYLAMASRVSEIRIFPFHNAKSFITDDEEPIYKKSNHDFTWLMKARKYKHSMIFDYGMEFQQLVNSFSGTDLYIIYYDNDWNLLLTSDDGGVTYRGFKTSMINFEEPNFPTSTESMIKKLVIELKDSKELSERGQVVKLPYPPEIIDRLFAQLTVQMYIDHAILDISFRGIGIDSILSSDVIVTDDYNGLISFGLFNYLGGVYEISDFDNTPTAGCITITNSLYIARIRYITVSDVVVTNRVAFEDGSLVLFENGDHVLFEN